MLAMLFGCLDLDFMAKRAVSTKLANCSATLAPIDLEVPPVDRAPFITCDLTQKVSKSVQKRPNETKNRKKQVVLKWTYRGCWVSSTYWFPPVLKFKLHKPLYPKPRPIQISQRGGKFSLDVSFHLASKKNLKNWLNYGPKSLLLGPAET